MMSKRIRLEKIIRKKRGIGVTAIYKEYDLLQKEIQKRIKKRKLEEFREFTSKINKNTNLSYVWKKMKIMKNAFINVKWKNVNNVEKTEIKRQEVEKLSPANWIREEKVNLDRYDIENSSKVNEEIQIEELERAIRRVKVESSPGLDNIEYRMIIYLPLEYRLELLYYIFSINYSRMGKDQRSGGIPSNIY